METELVKLGLHFSTNKRQTGEQGVINRSQKNSSRYFR
jgi:hypothetical protein